MSDAKPTILIACIGNIFLGDDGFGCEVAKVLQTRNLPENVKLFDYGIRGYDLAYALLDGYDVTIFVDAVPNRTSPGTIYVIEPDVSEFENMQADVSMLDAHTMNPMHVLRMAHSMGAKFNKLLLVGCEPETLGGDEGLMGLSKPVQTAVEKAADIVERLIAEILAERGETAFA
ncbi:MAG: hydrogenase maturation protease [Pyrinomonadaceae bacterium]